MGDFKVIETQEEFDKAIQKRLAQKDRELEEQYKDYLSPDKARELKAEYEKRLEEANKLLESANAKLKDHDKIVSDLTQRAQTAETSLLKSKVAIEKGIPIEFASRLMGSNEEELSKDAEGIAKLFGKTGTTAPPLYTNEVNHAAGATASDAAMLSMLHSLTQKTQ